MYTFPCRSLEEAIFEIGLIVLAVILYIGFGCLIDLKIIWKVIKRPIGPAVGFLSQFVIMPLVRYVYRLLSCSVRNLEEDKCPSRLGLILLISNLCQQIFHYVQDMVHLHPN